MGCDSTSRAWRRTVTPEPSGAVVVVPDPHDRPGPVVSQTWNATHEQIDGGKMDGFIRSVSSTSRWATGPRRCCRSCTRSRSTFTLANRWFCSAPCQTYPNRRFLMAGTAYGDIATDAESLKDAPPPNGTIFDRLHAYGISWRNYFTDLPQTAIIPTIIEKYPANLARSPSSSSTARPAACRR